MSTLEVDNVKKDSKTVDADYLLDGCLKAWAEYDQSSGNTHIDESLNISSITDIGTGQATLNFTNDFLSLEISATACCAGNGIMCRQSDATVSAISFKTVTDSGSANDYNRCGAHMVGDLA